MQSVFKNISFLKLLFVVSIFFGSLFSLITTTPVGAANKPIVRDVCYGIDNTYQTNYKSPYVTTNYMCLGKEISSELRFFQFEVNLPGVIKDASVSAVNGNNQKIFFNNTGDDKTYVSIPSSGAGVYGQGMGYGALTPSSGCNKDKANLVTITAKGNGKSVTIPQINLCSFSSETRTLISVNATGLTDDKGGIGNVSSIIGEFGSVRDDPIAASEKYGLYQKEGIVSIKLSGTATQTDKNGSWYELKDGKFRIPSLKPGPYSLVFTYSDKIVAANSSVGDVSDQAAENLTFTLNNFTVRANEPFNLTPGGIQYKDSNNTVVVGPVTDSELDTKTSCAIDGIGWIVCPVMNFMAGVVDGAYEVVEQLLITPPLNINTADPDNGTYQAWEIMRNIANIAFVIAFLIIIFSQLTNIGVGNYGIKKLLPRLVIAAILVNVSFFISALAVDASNIIGGSIRQLMGGIEAQITPPNFSDAGSTGVGWEGLSALLVGGTLVSITLYAGLSVLLPALIAALVAIVTVFLVLTLRQALLIMLIVISPLAFVAFLLPNTEDLFKKWRTLFMTLLLMFPIIAFIFGASSLASKVVMASDTASFPVQVMGALVAIIPLFITPIVMKTAGGVLNRFGGFINNPNKGPFDRMKKGADSIRARQQDRRGIRSMNGGKVIGGGQFRRKAKREAMDASLKRERAGLGQQYVAEEAVNDDGSATKFGRKLAGAGPLGQGADLTAIERAISSANFTIDEAEIKEAKAARVSFERGGLDANEAFKQLQSPDSSGTSSAQRTALRSMVVEAGDAGQIEALWNQSAGMAQGERNVLARDIAQNKPTGIGMGDIAGMRGGKAANFRDILAKSAVDGRYDAQGSANADTSELNILREVLADSTRMQQAVINKNLQLTQVGSPQAGTISTQSVIDTVSDNAYTAINDGRYQAGKSTGALTDISGLRSTPRPPKP